MVKQTEAWINKYFPVVRVNKKSLDWPLFNREPVTEHQTKILKMYVDAVKSGMEDFRVPIISPSFDKSGNGGIIFQKGLPPATGKSFEWWGENAGDILPQISTKVGSTEEWAVWLGTIMNALVKKCNYSIDSAWETVCDHSEAIGHYANSQMATSNKFEPTGSRKIDCWCDLGNTAKIIRDYKKGVYCEVGGSKDSEGWEYPLAEIMYSAFVDYPIYYATGWITGTENILP